MSDNRFVSSPGKEAQEPLLRSSERLKSTCDGDAKPVGNGHGLSNNEISVVIDPGMPSGARISDAAIFTGIISPSCCAYLTRFSGRSDSGEPSI